MPAYDFECLSCRTVFQMTLRVGERLRTPVRCPRCGSWDVQVSGIVEVAR